MMFTREKMHPAVLPTALFLSPFILLLGVCLGIVDLATRKPSQD